MVPIAARLSGLSVMHLFQEEREQLNTFVSPRQGDSELGSIDLVTHGIDSSSHPSINQPPQRLLLAPWQHVEEII